MIRQSLGRRGTTSVEFALVGLFVLGLMFGVVEAGQVMSIKHALDRSVTVAARWASVRGSASGQVASSAAVKAVAVSELQTLIGSGLGTPAVTAAFSPDNAPGSLVTVDASLSWTPIVAMALIPAMTLHATASMTIQN